MRRKRRSRAEWIRICREYAASGETAGAFACRRRLKQSTLNWWHSRLGRDGALEAEREAGTFVEVVRDVPACRAGGLRAVVRLGEVVVEFCDETPTAAWVAELARQC
jgi:hypothetical protein